MNKNNLVIFAIIKMSKEELSDTYQILRSFGFLRQTALELNHRLSEEYGCRLYLKREDQQLSRSFKIRGAFNKIRQIPKDQLEKGVVTCSAGNHAQGVAYSCRFLKVKCCVFIPTTTPAQKRQRIEELGREYVNLHIVGRTFDESLQESLQYAKEHDQVFVHPFDDEDIIIGQSSVSDEIFSQQEDKPDLIISPIGGGGLISGQLLYRKQFGHKHQIIGVQPKGAPSMCQSLLEKRVVKLDHIDTFVDGASVCRPGQLTFNYCQESLDQTVLINNDHLCDSLVKLYQEDGIIAEPAGALSVAALDLLRSEIKGKTVVCIISGGNNDILRYSEFIERALIFRQLIHYFVIRFPQRPGALEEFINTVLTKTEIDIIRFEYLKKSNKNHGSVLIGFQLRESQNLEILINRLDHHQYEYQKVEPDNPLYNFIV